MSRPHLVGVLPGVLQILLGQMPLKASVGNLASDSSLGSLLYKSQARDLALPVGDILGLDFNQSHPRIFRASCMRTIAKISKTSGASPGVHLLNPRIIIADVGHLTGNADPILYAAVLEGDQSGLVVVQVFELLGVVFGEEVKVGAVPLGNLHGAGDWADARAVGGEEVNTEGVGHLVEDLRGFVVPLLCDGGSVLELISSEVSGSGMSTTGCRCRVA